MSSGLIPLEDFEHAIAHLSFLPSRVVQPKEIYQEPPTEIGQKQNFLSNEDKGDENRGPNLPLEIIHMIASLLFKSSNPSRPPWLLTLQSPKLQDPSDRSLIRRDFRAILNLSSACKSFRSLLAPMIWQSISFHHPRHFGEFVQLMKRYKSISSPLSILSNGSTGVAPIYEWKQEYPLRLVRELHLVMPQKYPGFHQGLLVTLLREGMNHSLEHVVWEAEELPAASTLKAMLAEDYYSSTKRNSEAASSSSSWEDGQKRFGLASEIEEEDIVRWTQSGREGEAFPSSKGPLLSAKSIQDVHYQYRDEQGLQSLSVNCKCFWPGHASLSQFTSLQHIRFTYYDLFLLPPHLPALLYNLHHPLLSLSMSTSKTSLFHSIPLINSGCFDNLEILDLYPVTPEYPLPQAIHRSRKTLRILRLVMDISGSFTNFDNLWKILEGTSDQKLDYDDDEGQEEKDKRGSMEALEILHIDPMPQQNTAPSFVNFVESCPRLEWINGRRKDSFAPGFEIINPDEITSALYF